MEHIAISNIRLLQAEAINGKSAQSSDTDAAKDVLRSALQHNSLHLTSIDEFVNSLSGQGYFPLSRYPMQ